VPQVPNPNPSQIYLSAAESDKCTTSKNTQNTLSTDEAMEGQQLTLALMKRIKITKI